MRKLAIVLSLLLLGGCSNERATRAVVAMELGTINIYKNMSAMVEEFIVDFRTRKLATIDKDHAAAMASVTDANGKVRASTSRALLEKKFVDYLVVEQAVLNMRKKPLEVFKDVRHVMQYSAALKDYFENKQQTADMLQTASDEMFNILERYMEVK